MWRPSVLSPSWVIQWMTVPGQRTLQPASAFLSPSPSTTLPPKVRSLSSAGWRWFDWQWQERCQKALRPMAATWTTTTACKKRALIAHKGASRLLQGSLKKDNMCRFTLHAVLKPEFERQSGKISAGQAVFLATDLFCSFFKGFFLPHKKVL